MASQARRLPRYGPPNYPPELTIEMEQAWKVVRALRARGAVQEAAVWEKYAAALVAAAKGAPGTTATWVRKPKPPHNAVLPR